MGKVRDQMNAILDAFEEELSGHSRNAERKFILGKKVRKQLIAETRRRKCSLEVLLEEFRPEFIRLVEDADDASDFLYGEKPSNTTVH